MKELKSEREAVEDVIRSLKHTPIRFELLGASTRSPKDVSIQNVKKCDFFIFIVGSKFTDIVKEEYKTAEKEDKIILVFNKQKIKKDKEVKEFLQEIRDIKTYGNFTSITQLKELMNTSIQNEICERVRMSQGLDIQEPEIIEEINERKNIPAHKWDGYKRDLKEGNKIKGRIWEIGNDKINLYIMDEENFAEFFSGKEFNVEYECEGQKMCAVDFEIPYDDTWYVVVNNQFNQFWLFEKRVRFELKIFG
jgi:hypothetical protein